MKHLTLKKGQRIVMPVAEVALTYKDVYTLDIPFAPPRELQTQIRAEQQLDLLRLANRPKVLHTVRLANGSKLPLTTAPALIVSGDRVLGQTMMTYTAAGASVDLPVTTAVDIGVTKSEHEVKRTPKAGVWDGYDHTKVDLAGTITLTNFRAEPVQVEVTRNVLGNVGAADHGGTASMVNTFEDDALTAAPQMPSWWAGSTWPGWWTHFNGIGRIKWSVKLDPGKSADLGYTWHYFWR